jgi:membrane protein
MQGFLPEDALALLADYINRTLRGASSSVLFFGILVALWSGWAAADAMVKAINRAYELRETRPWWKLWGISVLMILGFMLVIATLAFVTFGPEVGGYVQRLTGLPDAFLALWGILRWVVAFLAVTLAHDLLYYVAPNAKIPFKWITPGGFTATVLILISGAALNLYVANFARYDQIYGPVGAIIVLMVWLYSTGLMVLIGAEMNAVLARMAEERKDTEIVQAESTGNE